MNKILEKARAIEQEIIADRRCLHQMPEVGVYTPRTAAYIKERLTEMGIAHRDCGVHSQEDREKMVFAGYPDAPTSRSLQSHQSVHFRLEHKPHLHSGFLLKYVQFLAVPLGFPF